MGDVGVCFMSRSWPNICCVAVLMALEVLFMSLMAFLVFWCCVICCVSFCSVVFSCLVASLVWFCSSSRVFCACSRIFSACAGCLSLFCLSLAWLLLSLFWLCLSLSPEPFMRYTTLVPSTSLYGSSLSSSSSLWNILLSWKWKRARPPWVLWMQTP